MSYYPFPGLPVTVPPLLLPFPARKQGLALNPAFLSCALNFARTSALNSFRLPGSRQTHKAQMKADFPRCSPVTPKETERENKPLMILSSPFSWLPHPFLLQAHPFQGKTKPYSPSEGRSPLFFVVLASPPKSRETRRPTCAPGKPRRSLSPGWQRGGRTVSEGSGSRLCAGPRGRAMWPQELVPGTAGSPARGRSAP